MGRGEAIVEAARGGVEPTRPYGVLIPDFYFDWLFPLLLPSEVCVLLYACRSILGYSAHRAERTDLISLTQIADGVRAGDHVYRRGTGLALSTIQAALAALERANILYPVEVVGGRLERAASKPRGRGHITRYSLVERAEDIDWEWLESRKGQPAGGQAEAAERPGAAESEAAPDKTTDERGFSADKTTDLPGEKLPTERVFSDKTTDLPPVKLPIIGSTDNNVTDNQLTECFAFGSDTRLRPQARPSSEGLKAYRKSTGFNPLPAARDALLELEREIGTAAFQARLKEFVLAGKNVRNVGFFLDFARGKAVLVKPRDNGNGKRNPGVRRRSTWTEEELQAAREADAGKEWPDPGGGGPQGGGGDVFPDAAEYEAWLQASGALGEDGLPTWDQLLGGPVYQAWRAQKPQKD